MDGNRAPSSSVQEPTSMATVKTTSTKASKKKVRYEPVLKLPPLPYEQFVGLRDSIALNGVLVPILVDSDGPVRKVIDGNYRKQIAAELGYDCPEVVHPGLDDDEKRTLARALNLARRHLTQEQKRELISDQLLEMSARSNRFVAKALGVHHATVAAVRAEMEGTGEISSFERTVGADGKSRPAGKSLRTLPRPPEASSTWAAKTTVIHGDCRRELKKIPGGTIDTIVTDPIYPEVSREYGRMKESDWLPMMKDVVAECRRVLKPKGSMVIILQPNSEKVGRMRLWMWEFLLSVAKSWNLVQDVYHWNIDALPLCGANRKCGLMRPSVKMCVWLGASDCYRCQDNVLWTPSQATSAKHRSDIALRTGPSGRTYRNSTISKAADERGGTTPFNLLPIPTGGQPAGGEHHPATTPYDLAAWWCKYLLPHDGVLLDPFCGSGTMLLAGLNHGASKVIGIERERNYVKIAERRIFSGE
jgi:predicted methyltransferase